MPGPLDPFTPGTDQTPFAGVDPGTYDHLRSQWSSFLDDPKGRAAIMSMGLALTAPPNFGDNALSQIGRAVGAGGQSAQLMESQDLKRTEQESKDAMREAQAQSRLMTAGAAEQRAEAASARLGTAGANLELRRQALDNALQGRNTAARLRLSQMYQNDVARINKENANAAVLSQPLKPILPFRDWVANNPSLRSLGLLDDTGQAPGTEDIVPPAADTTSQPVGGPKPGEVRKGYRFKGGNPADQSNWEKI
jgi:hypothetical protein